MSGHDLLLDTNVVIRLISGHADFKDIRRQHRYLLARTQISVISQIELLGFHNLSDAEGALLTEFVGEIPILALTNDIAERAIALRRQHRLKLPDAVILATARVHGLELLTLDVRLKTIAAAA